MMGATPLKKEFLQPLSDIQETPLTGYSAQRRLGTQSQEEEPTFKKPFPPALNRTPWPLSNQDVPFVHSRPVPSSSYVRPPQTSERPSRATLGETSPFLKAQTLEVHDQPEDHEMDTHTVSSQVPVSSKKRLQLHEEVEFKIFNQKNYYSVESNQSKRNSTKRGMGWM
jgi:hypothetical protein